MVAGSLRVSVSPGSEFARLLHETTKEGTPVLLEVDGNVYRLSQEREDDIWANYDPERVREALRRSAGALKGIDRDKFLADLKAQRGQDSHGRPA